MLAGYHIFMEFCDQSKNSLDQCSNMTNQKIMGSHNSYSSLTKEQLISHILQLERDFQDFSTQSSQVEDLLQQQLDSLMKQLEEKDQSIYEMSIELKKLEAAQAKVTALETDNDLLESTIRNLRAQLESEIERHNECVEKIAFLENELEWFKNVLKHSKESESHPANNSSGVIDVMSMENYINNGGENQQIEESWLQDWRKKEESWTNKINLLQRQLDELSKSKADLEQQLKQHLDSHRRRNSTEMESSGKLEKKLLLLTKHQDELMSSLRRSEQDRNALSKKLKTLQGKYSKVHQIAAMVKLRKHGLVKAYVTPALDPMA